MIAVRLIFVGYVSDTLFSGTSIVRRQDFTEIIIERVKR